MNALNARVLAHLVNSIRVQTVFLHSYKKRCTLQSSIRDLPASGLRTSGRTSIDLSSHPRVCGVKVSFSTDRFSF